MAIWGLAFIVISVATALGVRAFMDQSPKIVEMQTLWVRDYESIDELLASPETIAILGQVVETGGAYPVGRGLPFTDSIVRVDQVLHGELAQDRGGTLTVFQSGGEVDGVRQIHPDARLLREEERVILFLTLDPVFEKWGIIGAPHGHFTIDGNDVRHGNFSDPDSELAALHEGGHPLAVIAESRTPEQFIELVRDAPPAAQ